MILFVIFLILLLLILALLIAFLFYVLFPSINVQNKFEEDPVISFKETKYRNKESVESVETTDSKAFIISSGKRDESINPVSFNQEYTCALVNSVFGTASVSRHCCIGLGDCTKVCKQQAISLESGTAVVTNLCVGCTACVDVCPLGIIKMFPVNMEGKAVPKEIIDEIFEDVPEEKTDEKIISWDAKKDFKIWSYCYRILKYILK